VTRVKIATWNVNGIRARKDQVEEFIRAEQPDVVCLQELKAMADQVPEPLRNLDGYHCYWHGAKGYSGVALNVSKRFSETPPEFSHPPFDFENRIVVAKVGQWAIASIYVPNGGKDYDAKLEFLGSLRDYAGALRATGTQFLFCGDMNVTRADIDVHPTERKPNAIGQRPDERALFETILGHGARDVARDLDPDNDHLFTWWAPWRNCRQRDIGWRLDYVLASEAVAPRVKKCSAHREIGTSDHGPLIAVID
jgi:exodeoxyribonuclease III